MKTLLIALVTAGLALLDPSFVLAQSPPDNPQPSPVPSAEPAPAPSPRPVSPLVAEWLRGIRQLREIYRDASLDEAGVQQTVFETAATAFRAQVPESERPEIDRLIAVSRSYPPLYYGEDDRIWFGTDRGDRYSLKNLQRLHGSELLAAALLNPETVQDARELARQLGLPDPTQSEFATRTRQAGDLFSEAADGNGQLSVSEMTYLLNYFSSSVSTTLQMAREMALICGLSDPTREDALMNSNCFRQEVLRQPGLYFKNFPGLLSSDLKPEYIDAVLRTAGVQPEDERISILRVTLFNMILHLVEAQFHRFDRDRSALLDRGEVIASFSVFRREVSRISGLTARGWLEAAYTYLLRFGEPPSVRGGKLFKFLGWRISRPFWRLEVSRFQLVSVLLLVGDGTTLSEFGPSFSRFSSLSE